MAVEHVEGGRVRLSTAAGRWLIAATSLGSGMIFLDSTAMNVALPRIQSDLAAPLAGLQWIVNAYTLFLASFLMLGGGLGDRYGRKMAFLLGLGIFTLASVLCGLAPNLDTLIAMRALQGVGGALLVPGSLAMIQAVMAPDESGRAIGLWAGLSGVTTAIGPMLGGYLVGVWSWRAIFFLNVPLALVTLYAMAVHVPENRDEAAKGTLDWPGALTIVIGLGGLTYALIQGPDNGWGQPLVVLGIIVGVIGVVLFPLREWRARDPMVPLDIFRSGTFNGANVATLGVYFTFAGALLFLVLDLQQIQGYSPLAAGAALLPITLLLLGLSPRVGGLMNAYGARLFMTAGPLFIAAGFFLLSFMGRDAPYWTHLLPAIIILGFGMSLFVTPLTATVMGAVPPARVGVASGISNTLTRIASLLAIAILGLVIASRFSSVLAGSLTHLALPAHDTSSLLAHANRLADDPIPRGLSAAQRSGVRAAIAGAYVGGYRWAMWICGGLCVLSALVSWITVRSDQQHP